ncbi:Deoxyribodipyrimidine photolyase [Natrarchaeobaculum sulfurireducens]|uniref:Deoxyribodipyrimidine photolyase n=1 Tax=Natrarchaeobaculum sulfurireducens TaxID=2044521 RepID=A0A346PUA0_9EURY|nr:Deoxyribodipyrimidine photolyase [Natrarchaeobaculum sulfurireducens]AXR83095.1 Deoxyribodipyrimidine photolyase [Natrarchaeobaculum sulfurireducens]
MADRDLADEEATLPLEADIPSPAEAVGDPDATGHVVWLRSHLRIDDQLALTRAVADGDVICPLFVFDPSFYGDRGLACDARLRFLHEAVASLDRLYETLPTETSLHRAAGSEPPLREAVRPESPDATEPPTVETLALAESPGLTLGYGDPVSLLSRFVERGWAVVTMATPTSRYGKRRDDRARAACGSALEFVSGDGLVRDRERTRTGWADHAQSWLEAPQHTPAWDALDVTRFTIETGVTPTAVEAAFDVSPTKTEVPTGTHRVAARRLRSFIDRIESYPRRISSPQDARHGTSGLSPYLTFGLVSVRQVYQAVKTHASPSRGRELFTDRLFWNLHYNQKLADWPGWTERAVNPVFEGINEDRHDPSLVDAWKRGRTGFPMVDAAMRCLRESGWLNFRMRAMAASFFAHILQQPWWIGADWYHRHLIDSDVGINYTQWQSQASLVGTPAQRVYNPRKQVRDQDPDGEWITEWVPELAALPSQFLDRPERTPLAVQQECGVHIGDSYPRPVVDFEARRSAFWSRYDRRRAAAARALARPEVARRASFSGGYDAAKAIVRKYGSDPKHASDVQLSLSDAIEQRGTSPEPSGESTTAEAQTETERDRSEPPTDTGQRSSRHSDTDSASHAAADGPQRDEEDERDEQTRLHRFE